MSRWLAVLVVLVLGCGGPKRVRKPGDEYLAAVAIEGNTSIDPDDLVPHLALQRVVKSNQDNVGGRGLDPYQLQLDTQRIRAAYLRLGFFQVEVTTRVDRKGDASTVVFVVKEGPRATTKVEIVGLPPGVSAAEARRLIELRDGGPFDYELYDDAKQPLLELVESEGYAHAQLDAGVFADRARGVATVRYTFAPGPRCRFGEVSIAGIDGELEAAIRRRLAFREGDTYSPRKLAATQSALYELARFSTVRVEPVRAVGDDGEAIAAVVIPVRVSVALGNRREVKLGGGLGYDPINFEARVRAGGNYIPLDYPLWNLFADARIAGTLDHSLGNFLPKLRVHGTAQRVDLLRPRVVGEIGGGFDYVNVEAYTSTGPLARLGIATPLGTRALQLRAGWQFSLFAFTEVSELLDAGARASLGLDRAQQLGAYELGLVADLRDNPIDPRKGLFLSARATAGTPFAGSALEYVQLMPDVRAFVPLGRAVLALRVRGGLILGAVPVTERYFSGGAQRHRGFFERRLAPTIAGFDAEGRARSVVVGGAAMVETGAELRLPVGELFGQPWLGATVFLDGGDVTYDTMTLSPTDLHWAAGAGLAFKVASIKIRLDIGHRLNRKGPAEPQFGSNTAYHFGVGDTF